MYNIITYYSNVWKHILCCVVTSILGWLSLLFLLVASFCFLFNPLASWFSNLYLYDPEQIEEYILLQRNLSLANMRIGQDSVPLKLDGLFIPIISPWNVPIVPG